MLSAFVISRLKPTRPRTDWRKSIDDSVSISLKKPPCYFLIVFVVLSPHCSLLVPCTHIYSFLSSVWTSRERYKWVYKKSTYINNVPASRPVGRLHIADLVSPGSHGSWLSPAVMMGDPCHYNNQRSAHLFSEQWSLEIAGDYAVTSNLQYTWRDAWRTKWLYFLLMDNK